MASKSFVHYLSFDLDRYLLASSPTSMTWGVSLPVDEKCEWDLISITYQPGSTPCIDAGNPPTLDVTHIPAADSDASPVVVVDDFVLDTSNTSVVDDTVIMVFRGRESFLQGETLRFLIDTDGACDTPSVGASLTIEYEITERSGV